MYAKTLIPGPAIDVPGLLVTTSSEQALRDLRTHGWAALGDLSEPTNSSVRVGPRGLQVVVAGIAMLHDDDNPVPPPGWWAAIDRIGGRLAVQVVRTSDAPDLNASTLGATLQALVEQGAGVSALVPVIEWLD